MKNIFRHIPELIFAVSTIFVLLLTCYLGGPGKDEQHSGIIRTEKIITDEQFQYNILFGPVFHQEHGMIREDAAARVCIPSLSDCISL